MDHTVNIEFRMDRALKQQMEAVCEELGMSLTTAFTIFARKICRERRIPFEVSMDPFYSKENIDRLRRSIAQMESTGGTIHESDS